MEGCYCQAACIRRKVSRLHQTIVKGNAVAPERITIGIESRNGLMVLLGPFDKRDAPVAVLLDEVVHHRIHPGLVVYQETGGAGDQFAGGQDGFSGPDQRLAECLHPCWVDVVADLGTH